MQNYFLTGFPGRKDLPPPHHNGMPFPSQAGIVEGQKEWNERLGRLREGCLRKGEEEEGEGRRRFDKEDLVAIDQFDPVHQRALQITPTSNRLKYLEWKGSIFTRRL